MNAIDIARASGGKDVEIPTLELSCSAWPESKYICGGFFDQVFTTENGQTFTFQAAGIDVALPKRGNDGAQTLGIAIDNVRGEAQQLLDLAKSAGAKVFITYRLYLDSDHSEPCERPMSMTMLSHTANGPTVELQAGYFNLILSAWPRRRYTPQFSPGVKYIT